MDDNTFDVDQWRRKEIVAIFKVLDEARKQLLLEDIKRQLAEQQAAKA
jgi:hypothetical protein